MQNQYRGIAFFDLDHTLLDEHSQITPEVAAAMHQLRQNNYLPVINTGRSPLEIKEIRQQTEIETFISLNGAYVEHNHQAVYQSKIETELISELVQLVNKLGDAISFYSTDTIKTSQINKNVTDAYQLIHGQVPEADPKFYLNHDIAMLLLLNQDHDQQYSEQFPQFTYYRNSPYSIDTVLNGNSKMNGIKQLIQQLGLDNIPTYGFGDGPNDLSMLEFVDHPVSMGNGIPAVKNAAEFITTDNTDHGIVNGLRHFNLI